MYTTSPAMAVNASDEKLLATIIWCEAGNQARIPQSLLDGVRTMTANIVIEMGYAADLHRDALIATAVVLFIFIVIINVGFSHLKGKVVQDE